MHKILRNNYNFIISSKRISVLTFISNIKSIGIYKFNMLNNRLRFNYLFHIFAYFFSFLCHTRSYIIYMRVFRTRYVTLTYTNVSGLTNLLSFKTFALMRSDEFYGHQAFPFIPYRVAADTLSLRGYYLPSPRTMQPSPQSHP